MQHAIPKRPPYNLATPAHLIGLVARIKPCCWHGDCNHGPAQSEYMMASIRVRVTPHESRPDAWRLVYVDRIQHTLEPVGIDATSEEWEATIFDYVPQNALVLEFETISLDYAWQQHGLFEKPGYMDKMDFESDEFILVKSERGITRP